VDRTTEPRDKSVDEAVLMEELRTVAMDAVTGAMWTLPQFRETPEHLRRIRDFAMAGDGEPTSYKHFDRVIEQLIQLKLEIGLPQIKIIVLTNASLFHLPHVRRGLEALAEVPSDIWCKLDAGTEEYFGLVNRSNFRLAHCLDNISWLARQRPVTIQSMFMKFHGIGPSTAELSAYIDNLRTIVAAGGAIRLVQVYTIARVPGDRGCTALSNGDVDEIVDLVRREMPELDVQGYYGKTFQEDVVAQGA
jgi:wyosine [tRNA(Phe)-imidazoG37] synthetase (radical SAM superfamily)